MANRIIRDPERYFNRYIACEVKSDRRRAAEVREAECSLDEKLESDKHPRELICNLHGEILDSVGGFLDRIEDERLHAALCALSSEQLKIIIMICEDCLTQREIAGILGVSQAAVAKQMRAIKDSIKKHFSKCPF